MLEATRILRASSRQITPLVLTPYCVSSRKYVRCDHPKHAHSNMPVDAIIACICNRLASAISAEYFTAAEFAFRVRMNKSSTVIHGTVAYSILQSLKDRGHPSERVFFFHFVARASWCGNYAQERRQLSSEAFKRVFKRHDVLTRDRLDLSRRFPVARPFCK